MIETSFKVKASDGLEIHVREWLPENGKADKILYIVHGMLEHGGRFGNWAERFVKEGFHVYADDHRGHGLTAQGKENLGHIADEKGAEFLIQDCLKVEMAIREKEKDKPFFLMGHSMGSFIVRNMITAGRSYSGVIISGTKMAPLWQIKALKAVVKVMELFIGKRGSSKIVHNIGMVNYNRKIKNRKTQYDWLTRRDDIVELYVKDPLCGVMPTIHFYHDLLSLLQRMTDKNKVKNGNRKVPLLIYAGKEDPVGVYGKEVRKSAEFYQKMGYENVTLKLYSGARHEMHNETDANDCFKDVLCWINSKNCQ